MVALRERQYERIVDLAVTILRSHQTSSPWPSVMDELAEALHCNAGIFADARHGPSGLRATVEAWTPAPLADLPLDTLLQQYVTQHPMSRHYLTTGDRSALVMGDLLHERDWRRTDVYNSTRTLAGFTRHIAVALPAPRGSLRALLFGRPGRDFGDADRALLQRVQPLLTAADANVRELRRRRATRTAAPAIVALAEDAAADLRLTPRELNTLNLLAESLTAAAIARRLGISIGTVHKHLAGLYRKLGTRDRLETVLRAQRLGLLTDPPSPHASRTTHG
jgi:DNA-binding CsgD family transcriptional regulator